MNQKDTPGTETKMGRVFQMVILSKFQLIQIDKKSQNKNSQFSQHLIYIRNQTKSISSFSWFGEALSR